MQRFPRTSNLVVTLWIAAWLILIHFFMTKGQNGDLNYYLDAAKTGHGFYYSYYILPFFDVLSRMPHAAALLAMQAITVIGVIAWARTVTRPWRPAFFSFPMIFVLISGNATGMLILGTACLWRGCYSGKWLLASWGLPLVLIKPQWGLPILVAILWHARPTRLNDWLVLSSVFVALNILALALYGFWPLELIETIATNPPDANASLWQWTGPGIGALWVMCLPDYNPNRRVQVVIGCSSVATPYMPVYDMLIAYVFMPWWVSLATWLILPAYIIGGRLSFMLLMIPPIGLFAYQVSKMIARSYRLEVRRVPTAHAG